MAIVNAIFAPFIVLYLLMYSFFRYFEVSSFSSPDLTPLAGVTEPIPSMTCCAGIPQEPVFDWRADVYAVREVEVPRVQRAPAPVPDPTRLVSPDRQEVHRPVSEGTHCPRHEVSQLPHSLRVLKPGLLTVMSSLSQICLVRCRVFRCRSDPRLGARPGSGPPL